MTTLLNYANLRFTLHIHLYSTRACCFCQRLGLGATYNSKLQKPSLTESDRRMAGSIRAEAEREKARTDDDGDHESSDSESEDHPDSRAAFLGARVR